MQIRRSPEMDGEVEGWWQEEEAFQCHNRKKKQKQQGGAGEVSPGNRINLNQIVLSSK